MKSLKNTLLLVALGSVATLGANASMTQDYKPYVGAKVANVMFDDVDDIKVDSTTGLGLYAGIENANGFGIEVDYLKTNDADVEYNNQKIGEAEYQTYGLSGVYRHSLASINDGLYLKGKLGVRNVELKVKGDDLSTKGDDTNFSWGAGVGYKYSDKFGSELTYEQHDSDLDMVSLSAYMKF